MSFSNPLNPLFDFTYCVLHLLRYTIKSTERQRKEEKTTQSLKKDFEEVMESTFLDKSGKFFTIVLRSQRGDY